jgi:hypothetical protein
MYDISCRYSTARFVPSRRVVFPVSALILSSEPLSRITSASIWMSSSPPTVSVVIPCYSAVGFVPQALESVFAQTYTDFEVLVVNDGSPHSAELESILTPYRSRIRYLCHDNRGPGAARNTGIREASGKYIAFLDSDDAWFPEFLIEHVRTLDADPSLNLVFGESVLFGDRARADRPGGREHRARVQPTFENLVRRRCHVHPSCVVARRSSLVAAGLFDEKLTYSEDLDLWARITHGGGRIDHSPGRLTRRRVHGQSLTVRVDRLILGQLEMSRKLLATLPELTRVQRAALEDNIARCEARLQLVRATEHLYGGRFAEASAALVAADVVLRNWKVRGAIVGLRIAPRVVRGVWLRLLAEHPTVRRLRAEEDVRSNTATQRKQSILKAGQALDRGGS